MSDAPLRSLLEGMIVAEPLLAAEALEAVQLGSEDPPESFEGLKTAARFLRQPYERLIVDGLASRKLLRAFTLALSVRGAALPKGWEVALQAVVEHREIQLNAEEAPPDDAPPQEVPEADGLAPPANAAMTAGHAVTEEEEEEEEEEEGEGDDGEDLDRRTIAEEDWERFLRLVRATRCRIRVGGRPAGSGLLVGPSTVITTWHVIRDLDRSPALPVDIDFADGSRIPAVLPARFQSRCGERELDGLIPQNDNEVAEAHDVALLQLRRPVGASLGHVILADADTQLKTRDSMLLVQYPGGTYRGISLGIFCKLRGLSARWGHSAASRGGSSGGGCFNSKLLLVGLHQGRSPAGKGQVAKGRLVPASRFPPALREMILADEAPPQVWSLDGTAHGLLVVGRQDFFAAFAAASRSASRVRGIRVRRVDAEADTTGIPFSYLMLEYLVARAVGSKAMRIAFEANIPEFTDEVVKRAALAGFDIGPVPAMQGVDPDQTTLEAAASDRARRAAVQLNAAAAAACTRLWIFLEHPSAVFGDTLRVAFEAFVDQGLRLDNLRLVVAGYEAVTVPGQEFRYASDADRDGPPGLMTEFLDGFRRSDVERLIATAASNLGVVASNDRIRDVADRALEHQVAQAGVYAPTVAGAVAAALRPELLRLARKSPVAGAGHGG